MLDLKELHGCLLWRTRPRKENSPPLQASFLDLSIYIQGNRFNTTLYHKRYTFPFSIVHVSHHDNNLISKIFYASSSSNILYLARTNSKNSLFINTTIIFLRCMYKHGCKWEFLKNVIDDRHVTYFKKSAYSAEKPIDLLFSLLVQ